MKTLPTLAALAAAAALLGGCASSPMPQQTAYTQDDAATYGIIDNIQVVQVEPRSSGAGAVTGGLVGALLGNQIGSGSGRTAATVAGAVGGAVVGNNVEQNHEAAHTVYRISVRMNNGEYRSVDQDSAYDLQAGNRVHVVDGRVYRY